MNKLFTPSSKQMYKLLVSGALNGKKIDTSQFISLSGGKGLETVYACKTLEEINKIFAIEDDAKRIKELEDWSDMIIKANFIHLTKLGVSSRRSAMISVFRSLMMTSGFYPMNTKELRLPALEVVYAVYAYPENTVVPEVADVMEEVYAVYGSIDNVLVDLPIMIVLAAYFRMTMVHLWQNAGAHEKKFTKIATASRASVGTDKIFMFDEIVLRGVMHAMGLFRLHLTALRFLDTVPQPLRLRFNSPPSGASLIPTTLAALQLFIMDPANSRYSDLLAPLMPALAVEAALIRTFPMQFALHHNLYGVKNQTIPLSVALCTGLAAMLAGWLDSISSICDMKGQKVISRAAASQPESVALFSTLFTKARKQFAEKSTLSDLMIPLAQTLLPNLAMISSPNDYINDRIEVIAVMSDREEYEPILENLDMHLKRIPTISLAIGKAVKDLQSILDKEALQAKEAEEFADKAANEKLLNQLKLLKQL